MAEILRITLTNKHESRLKFEYSGKALPVGASVLPVRKGDGGSWEFKCRSEGGGRFTITGRDWENFFKRYNTGGGGVMVTLSMETGDEFYTISVR